MLKKSVNQSMVVVPEKRILKLNREHSQAEEGLKVIYKPGRSNLPLALPIIKNFNARSKLSSFDNLHSIKRNSDLVGIVEYTKSNFGRTRMSE